MSDQPTSGEFHGIGPTAEHFPPTTTGWCIPQNRCGKSTCPICEAIKSNQPKPTTGKHGFDAALMPFPDRFEEPLAREATQAAMKQIKDWALWIAEPLLQDEDQRAAKIAAIIDDTLHGDTTALDAAVAEATKDLQHALIDTLNQREDAIAEAQQPLVDELTRMSFSYLATADELRQMARDALAKVKEGK